LRAGNASRASARRGARPRIRAIRRGLRAAVDRGWIAVRSREPLVAEVPSAATAPQRDLAVGARLVVGIVAIHRHSCGQ